jgi:lipopolysaccharide transport system permease protein
MGVAGTNVTSQVQIADTESVTERPSAAPGPAESSEPAGVPETVIERRHGWRLADLEELWRFRELLYFLIWRDIKVRYKQTVLGAAWTVLQPLAMMAVFCLFLGRLAAASGEIPNYPLFVFAGLLPWTFFSSAVSAASHSVVGNQSLVTKVYFPRLLIPTGAVGACLFDFAITFVLLLVLMGYYGAAPSWSVVLVPVLLGGLVVAALGIGTLLAALTVSYRDFRHIVPFLVQIWMFATPSIYVRPETFLGPQWQWALPLNPAFGLIANFREAMLGGRLDWYSLTVSAGVSLSMLVLGLWYFRRVERDFADVI